MTDAPDPSGIHAQLNREQMQAVLCNEPLFIVAGAGTGKTRVITHKVAHLISHHRVAPNRILAITFTKKAASEMSERIQKMTSIRPKYALTFHSLCVKILRPAARLITGANFDSHFTIYDEQDTKKLVKEIMRQRDSEAPESDDVDYAIGLISSVKQDYCPDPAKAIEELPHPQCTYAPVARQYQERLRESNAMDFDDLQQYAYQVLSTNPAVRNHWSGMFEQILVDEYQDTNTLQAKLLNALHREGAGICAVGDPQQCLYTWRGADPRNIFDFISRYGATEIKLEQNYRSTPNILRAANHTVSFISEEWKDKVLTLWTRRTGEGPLHVDCYSSDLDEADAVADRIRRLTAQRYKNSDIAILCRLNHMMRSVENALLENGIPYQMVGGTSFHQKSEIRDMMAYLRLYVNPKDKSAFYRAANVPPRSVGKKTLSTLAAHYQGDWLTTAEQANNGGARMMALAGFTEMARRIAAYAEQRPYDALMETIEKTNYEGYLRTKYRSDHDDRMGNVSELANMLRKAQDDNVSLSDFLDDNALSSSQDALGTDNTVKIMTVHASKGLEFPVVFVVGLEENLFPSYRALEQAETTEEERRCFYVSVTRSKDALYLSRARERMRFGEMTSNEPSRYLEEIKHLANGR